MGESLGKKINREIGKGGTQLTPVRSRIKMTPQRSLIELPSAFKNKNYTLNSTLKIVRTPQKSPNQNPYNASVNKKESEIGIRLIRRMKN